jgi:hypothetical protein
LISRARREYRDAQQIVRGGEKVGGELVGAQADVTSLAEVANRFDPAEGLLDTFAQAPANGVADVGGRALVDVRASPSASSSPAIFVLHGRRTSTLRAAEPGF